MAQDGYDVEEHRESVEAVRAVVREALDRDATWADLAAAGLLGLPVPEAHGGEGLGLAEVGVLLHETGARAVRLPVWETLACAVPTLVGHGTDAQRKEWLPGVAAGEVVLSPALRERGARPGDPPTTTYADGAVSGRKIAVTHALDAARLLVTARDGERTVVALVDRPAPGCGWRSRRRRAGSPGTPSCSTSPPPSCSRTVLPRRCSPTRPPAGASPPPASSPAPAT
ncbi:acyl-CoA dehydrogenase family protein [Nocardioides marinisabuli]|uniref:acyl-CoA dehydrogenase family protein n=1 Tax=Nocardioides marinisabuli TaxID=419476 RepID=UPI002155EF49|nr:acyl-CoA dehydrogenase family protein [Nocardioides marinisabuli]